MMCQTALQAQKAPWRSLLALLEPPNRRAAVITGPTAHLNERKLLLSTEVGPVTAVAVEESATEREAAAAAAGAVSRARASLQLAALQLVETSTTALQCR